MVSPNKAGMVVGALVGGWHLLWLSLVLLHWAQPVLDFIFWAHMIHPVYSVKPFNGAAAITLLTVTTALGYSVGVFGAIIWNRLRPS